jgi:polygalacturonase
MTKTRDLANLANGITSANIVDGAITNSDVNNTAGIVSSKLNFTQAGSGATQRTVESKLQEVVSVKDFGAVGDGIANDAPKIQAAINTGKSVFLPNAR